MSCDKIAPQDLPDVDQGVLVDTGSGVACTTVGHDLMEKD